MRPGRPAIDDLLAAAALFLCLFHFPLLSSCAHTEADLIEIGPAASPFFIDDASAESLIISIDRHLAYLDRVQAPPAPAAGPTFTGSELAAALTSFRTLLLEAPDPVALNREIRERFRIYQARGRNDRQEMLVTGYYEPLVEGSMRPTPLHRYPLYRLPEALVLPKQGPLPAGRRDAAGRLLPFWTRREIDSGNLLAGSELLWLADRLDAYLLQVQGSGRVRLPDGSTRALHFAGTNGHPYRSLGQLLVDEGIMSREEVSIEAIRAYFADHPEDLERMLFANPRYVFFKWGDDRGPRGSLGEVLTAQRSVAIDHAVFPTGAIGYLVSRRPILNGAGGIDHWRSFGRFVLPQDSGAAIKGPGRVDLFLGGDYYAEKAAGAMKEPGSLYFLLPRDRSGDAR